MQTMSHQFVFDLKKIKLRDSVVHRYESEAPWEFLFSFIQTSHFHDSRIPKPGLFAYTPNQSSFCGREIVFHPKINIQISNNVLLPKYKAIIAGQTIKLEM